MCVLAGLMSTKTAMVNSSGLWEDLADTSATDRASNRQSNAEEDANTSNDQTIDEPDEMINWINWATRNEIILVVNEYSKCLFSESIAENDKKNLTDRHFKLYQTLASLPPKGGSIGNGRSDEIVLQLKFDAKLRIVNSLLKNHNLAIVCDLSETSSKLELIEENNELLSFLMKLPVKIVKQTASSGKHANLLMTSA